MKPHEETWTASVEEFAGYDCMTDAVVVRTGNGSRVCDFTVDDARARLAAQAPAMARLLLSFWLPSHHPCPACRSFGPAGHRDDCALVAVLRAAGVIG